MNSLVWNRKYLPYDELKIFIRNEFNRLGEAIVQKTAKKGVYDTVDFNQMPVEETKNRILNKIMEEMKFVVDIWTERVRAAKEEFLEAFQKVDYKSNLNVIKAEVETASINIDYFLLNYNAFDNLLVKVEKYLIEYQMYSFFSPFYFILINYLAAF